MISFCYFLLVLSVLISVAFFTLLEVRLLGLIHLRFGPNRVGFAGYFQPFSDFVKLFTKFFWLPGHSDVFFYCFSPFLALLVGFSLWFVYIGRFTLVFFVWGSIYFFCLSSLIVFFLLFSGWSSGSSYSSLGSFRSAAQAVSYEVVIIFVVFSLVFFCGRFDFYLLGFGLEGVFTFLFCLPLFFCWLISCLAESSRAPFDFSEGESELVSGFNTEYLGGFFSFIFIAEYGFMLFFGCFTSLIFWGGQFIWIFSLLMLLFFILVRGCYPRFRFDWLMYLMWKTLLPLIIGLFVFCSSFAFF